MCSDCCLLSEDSQWRTALASTILLSKCQTPSKGHNGQNTTDLSKTGLRCVSVSRNDSWPYLILIKMSELTLDNDDETSILVSSTTIFSSCVVLNNNRGLTSNNDILGKQNMVKRQCAAGGSANSRSITQLIHIYITILLQLYYIMLFISYITL